MTHQYMEIKIKELEKRIEALEQKKPETVTEFADRCRECGAMYGKLLEDYRQAVEEAISGTIVNGESLGHYVASEILPELPPVKPQPKIGHWIESEMSIANIDGIKVMGHTCSECKYYFGYKVKFNYCPNCGAKMAESESKRYMEFAKSYVQGVHAGLAESEG